MKQAKDFNRTKVQKGNAMNMNQIEELNEVLEERGAGFRAREEVVIKPHAVLKGIRLEKEGCKVSPTLYLREEEEEKTVEEYADHCMELMSQQSYMQEEINMNIEKYVSQKYILENVLPRLTHQDNLDRLNRNNTYYIRMLDLVVFFYIPVCRNNNGEYEGSITISKDLIKSADINAADLYDIAVGHLENKVEIKSMFETLSKMIPTFAEDEPEPIDDGMLPRMYVASNISKQKGASVILTQKFKENIRKIFGDKAIIIPSSIHEVIIVDYSDETARETAKMIQEVNRTQVAAEDVLSDHPYFLINGDIFQYDISATH